MRDTVDTLVMLSNVTNILDIYGELSPSNIYRFSCVYFLHTPTFTALKNDL